MTDSVQVRRGEYRDSVSLMQASRWVQQVDGVTDAMVAMATELNLALLAGMGFPVPGGAGPNDLVVAVRGSDAALDLAAAALDAALAAPGRASGGSGPEAAARTVRAAARRRPDATLALVSVPGRAAFPEAMDALEAGLSVLLFSDNVPVEQEVRLKEEAARRDLLVMGPDCGTAVVGGAGLGFANVVSPGPVGIVAASGTGAQQLMCLLDAAGVGVSSVLGVGGRDLSAAVAGRSTLQALAALEEDPATELVVLISKPADPAVAARLEAQTAAMSTPVVLALLGPGQPDLTDAAARAVRALGGAPAPWQHWPALTVSVAAPLADGAPMTSAGTDHAPVTPAGADSAPAPLPGALRGLFSGGTLCLEAMCIAAGTLGPVASNIPLREQDRLPPDLRSPGHLFIDFGADELTSGRPHPMIDPSPVLERLAVEAADPATSVLLLDVVLGSGAHPDPTAALTPAVAAARATAAGAGRDLAVVVSLCGTTGDPQGLERQAAALVRAGASVYRSNAEAALYAVSLVGG